MANNAIKGLPNLAQVKNRGEPLTTNQLLKQFYELTDKKKAHLPKFRNIKDRYNTESKATTTPASPDRSQKDSARSNAIATTLFNNTNERTFDKGSISKWPPSSDLN